MAGFTSTRPDHQQHGSTPATSGWRLLVAVVAAAGGSVAAAFTTVWVAGTVAPEWASDPNRLAVVIVAEVYALVVAALLVAFRGRTRLRRGLALGTVGWRDHARSMRAWAGAYGLAFAGYGIAAQFVSLEPTVSDVLLGIGSDNARLADAGVAATTLILARVLFLVPLGEELLFRGALFGWLRRRLPAWSTIALTAVAWALIHQVPVVWPLALVVGIAAGWIRERTGSVWPLIVTHAVQSVIIVAVSWAATGWRAPLPM